MEIVFTLQAATEADTRRIGAALAARCRAGDCIALRGDLGAGKTSFARGFIQALAQMQEEIVSPTFTLVQTYDAVTSANEPVNLWHCDLYRLERAEEAQELGLEEALEHAITLIEWPEIIEGRLPAQRLEIAIKIAHDDTRVLAFSGDASWGPRLASLKK